MTDWDLGEYERTAERLAPAAEVAVQALGPLAGLRVADLGCGTGNAALRAARAGATAVGFDTAPRLIEVARRAADAEGLDATFEVADARSLPAPDGSYDAAVSVFGVIFADAVSAAREVLRVVRPGGRIVLTTWTTDGATPRAIEAIREALGAPPEPPSWSDPEFVRALFTRQPIAVDVHELAFTAPSAEAYVAEQLAHHPMWIAATPRLRGAGRLDEVVAKVTAVFAEANEDPGGGFCTTSRYQVFTVGR